MRKKLILVFIIFASATNSYGQDSTVPDSVRAMIERSQVATRFEQTARMQMSVQYQDFLDSLAGDRQRISRIEAVFIEVLSKRAELSSQVTSGQASADELEVVSDYAYLRAHLEPVLTDVELSVLDSRRGGPSDEQLKKDYAEELSRTSGDLTEANRELVLDTLVKHMRLGRSDAATLGRLSVDDLIARDSQSLMQAADELQSQLTGSQLQLANTFLNQLQSNLYRNRSMSDATR